MKRLLMAVLLCSSATANAATYYISTTGSDSGNGSSGQPWATFAHAWTGMASGDTLIVKDGTYTQQIRPPATLNGSAGAYTTIRAEHDWVVTIDGSSGIAATNGTLMLSDVSYFVVRGMKFKSNPSYSGAQSPVVVTESDHIKLIKLAGYDSPCTNNTAVFSIGPGDSYTLVEDSYAWGCGRYKFLVYQGHHVIVRHSVARHDYHDITGWPGVMSGWGRQCADFAHYDDYEVLWQNVIAIDSGVADKSTGSYWGGWWAPDGDVVAGHGTNGKDMSGKIQGSIFVNNITGTSGATINDAFLSGTREIVNTALAGNDTGISMTRDDTTTTASFLGQHLTIANTTGTHSASYETLGIAAVAMNNTNVTQALIRDSIIMNNTRIGRGTVIERSILDKQITVGDNCRIGYGDDFTVSRLYPEYLNSGITVIGKGAEIPAGMTIGRNCKIDPWVPATMFTDPFVPSGESIEKPAQLHPRHAYL
jgi:acetyltransferase-like isoleucine patch superfamily enzyme